MSEKINKKRLTEPTCTDQKDKKGKTIIRKLKGIKFEKMRS